MPFGLTTRKGTMNHVLDAVQITQWEGAILGKIFPVVKYIGTVFRKLCKNIWIKRDAVWDAESGGPKERPIVVQIPHGKGKFVGEEWHAPTCRGHSAVTCAKTAEPIEMPCGLSARVRSVNHVLDGVQIPVCKKSNVRGQDTPDDNLPSAMQKRLKRSRCHLRCGLEWTEGSMCYTGAHWHHLANMAERSMCGSNTALCQIILTTC